MRASVFVDGANLSFMQKEGLGWFADLKKLLKYIETQYGEIADSFYYIGKDASPDARQQSFLDTLPSMGYSVVFKPIKTILDAKTGITKKKANFDIEIVLDMFNTIDSYDLAVLVSGDGDFDRALQLLKARDKKRSSWRRQDSLLLNCEQPPVDTTSTSRAQKVISKSSL